jgi:drug/metabolite transporter (DMT)-like permease
MSVPLAYLGVILIWSTTPLAIWWSSHGVGFLPGVTSRMTIGAVLALMLTALPGLGMRWHAEARRAYVAGGLGIFGSMFCVYWASQYIPSGWIAVVFGMSPLATALMASRWLQDEPLTGRRIAGMLLGLAGLAVIFGGGLQRSGHAGLGVAGVLTGMAIQAASSVWVKRIDARLPGLVMASGGLLVAAPLFLLAWLVAGGPLPTAWPARAAGAIAYLALFGSVFGFAMYFHVLRHVQATRVALITLVTPVTALALGHALNGEAWSPMALAGAALIGSGLALFEFRPAPGGAIG